MSELQAYNPWPTIFRKKYDFDFENKLKDKVIDSLKASDRFIKSMDMVTPEKMVVLLLLFWIKIQIFLCLIVGQSLKILENLFYKLLKR